MTLDPTAAHMLELLRSADAVPIDQAKDLVLARQAARAGVIAIGLDPPPGVLARDVAIESGDASFGVRIYRPEETEQSMLPVVILLHGGGWVVCDLESHDHICRHLAKEGDCAVVSVDYRLAPEHPFPAAVADTVEALVWTATNADSLAIDRNRIALFGDSAGGNLAAVAALMAGRGDIPPVCLQILVYPVCDVSRRSQSYERNGRDYVLPQSSMEFFIKSYVPEAVMRTDWRASPALSTELGRSPPTIIYTAEYDVLHDEGAEFAAALSAAGVAVEHREIAGHMHGFLTSGKLIPVAKVVLQDVGADLRRHFASVSA